MPNRSFVWLLGLLLCVGLVWNAAAQPSITLTVSASPTSVAVSNTLVYTLVISNASSSSALSGVIVTDTLPSTVTLLSISGGQGTNVSGNVVTITNGILNFQQSVANTITVRPTLAGTISNFATVRALGPLSEQVGATNSIVTTVTNAGQANIQGIIKTEPQNVYVDDRVVFSTAFTNIGTATAQNVVVSNLFSTDVILRSVSPSNLVSAFTGTKLLLDAGSLAPMASGAFTFVVQPTNAGTLVTMTTILGSNVDTNSIQSASLTNVVSVPNTNQLQVTAGQQIFDPQTGLFRQIVQVSNMSGSNVTSVRVVVMGLGTNKLFNAVGTNGENPFVVFGATLPDGASTNIVLEYFVKSRTPVEGLSFVAYEANAPASTGSASGEAPEIVRVLALPPDRLLLEFTSEPGATYRILYSDNSGFTNALLAQPGIIAPADRTQWIDEGPPKTISPLINTNRFYRVIKQ